MSLNFSMTSCSYFQAQNYTTMWPETSVVAQTNPVDKPQEHIIEKATNEFINEGQLFTMRIAVNEINAVNVAETLSVNSINKPNIIDPNNSANLFQQM